MIYFLMIIKQSIKKIVITTYPILRSALPICYAILPNRATNATSYALRGTTTNATARSRHNSPLFSFSFCRHVALNLLASVVWNFYERPIQLSLKFLVQMKLFVQTILYFPWYWCFHTPVIYGMVPGTILPDILFRYYVIAPETSVTGSDKFLAPFIFLPAEQA